VNIPAYYLLLQVLKWKTLTLSIKDWYIPQALKYFIDEETAFVDFDFQGIIRVWDLPLSSECETYPTNPRSYCLTTLNAHEDSIWELTHHPFKVLENLLTSQITSLFSILLCQQVQMAL